MGHEVLGVFLLGTSTDIDCMQLEAVGAVAPIRCVFRQKEKRLKTIQDNFSNNEYSLDEHIGALSNLVGFRKLYIYIYTCMYS